MGIRDYNPNVSGRGGIAKYNPNIIEDAGNQEGNVLTDLPSAMLEAHLGMKKGIAQFIGATGKVAKNKKVVDWSKRVASDIDDDLREGFSAVGRNVTWKQPARKLTRIFGQGVASSGMGYAGGITGGTIAKTLGYAPKTAALIGTMIGVAPMGLAAGGQFFTEGEAAGRRDDVNYIHSLVQAAGIAYLEGLPAFHWLKGGFGTGKRTLATTLRAAGKQGAMEATEELAQNIWTAVNKAIGWKGTKDLYKDATEGLVDQMLGGFMVGGVMGGAGGPQYEDFVADTRKKWIKAGVVGNDGKALTTTDVESGLEEIRQQWNMQDSLVRDKLKEKLTRATSGTSVAELVARPDPETYDESTVEWDEKKRRNRIVVKKGVEHVVPDVAKGEKLKIEKERQQRLDAKWKLANFQIGPRDLSYSELPTVLKNILESIAHLNNDVELLQLFNAVLSENVAYVMEGDPTSERSVVFFGPLQKAKNWEWRSETWDSAEKISPKVWLRDLAPAVVSMGIDPTTIKFRGKGAAQAQKTFLNKYNKSQVQLIAPQVDYDIVDDTQVRKEDVQEAAIDAVTRKVEQQQFQGVINKTWADIKRLNPKVSLANKKMLGWLRKMIKKGHLNVKGIEAKTIEDVAGIASMFRNPSIEIGQIVAVKDGIIVGHSAYEAKSPLFEGSPSGVIIPAPDVEKMMTTLSPDAVYLVHNHPAGDPNPSWADTELHIQAMKSLGDVYQGHIVLDGDTFAFLANDPGIGDKDAMILEYSGISFKPEHVVKTVEELSTLVKDNFKKNKAMVIYQTASNGVLSIDYLSPTDILEQVLRGLLLHKAAVYDLAVTGMAPADISKLNQSLPYGLREIIYTDKVSGKQRVYGVDKDAVGTTFKRIDVWKYKGSEKFKSPLSDFFNPKNIQPTEPSAFAPQKKEYSALKGAVEPAKGAFEGELPIEKPSVKAPEHESFIQAANRIARTKEKLHHEEWLSKLDSVVIPINVLDQIKRLAVTRYSRDITDLIISKLESAYAKQDAEEVETIERSINSLSEYNDLSSRKIRSTEGEAGLPVVGALKNIESDAYAAHQSILKGIKKHDKIVKRLKQRLSRAVNKDVVKHRIETEENVSRELASLKKEIKKEYTKDAAFFNRNFLREEATGAEIIDAKTVVDRSTGEEVTLSPGLYRIEHYDDSDPGQISIDDGGRMVYLFTSDLLNSKGTYDPNKIQFYEPESYDMRSKSTFKPKVKEEEVSESGPARVFRPLGENVQHLFDIIDLANENRVPYLKAGDPAGLIGTYDINNLVANASPLRTAFDGKSVEPQQEAPTEGARHYNWKLRNWIKMYRLAGTEEEAIQTLTFLVGDEKVNSWKKEVKPQEQQTIEKFVKQAMKDRNFGDLAAFKGAEAADLLVQELDKFVINQLPPRKGAIDLEYDTKKREWIEFWNAMMNYAAEEVIPVSMTKYALSDIGHSHHWNDGRIPGDLLSEMKANVKSLMRFYIKLNGVPPPETLVKSWEAKRPELAFFSLLPKQLQNLLLWSKSSIEDPLFFDLVKWDVLARADNAGNRRMGFTHSLWVYDPGEEKQRVPKRVLQSTDVPQKKYRTYAEFVESTNSGVNGVGLKAVESYSASVGDYVQTSLRKLNQMNTINQLSTIKNPDSKHNLALITYTQDPYVREAVEKDSIYNRPEGLLTSEGYVQLKEAEGLVRHHKGQFQRPWVHESIAKVLENWYIAKEPLAKLQAWNRLNGVAKRIIMLSPYQFALQIVSSPALWLKPSEIFKTSIDPMLNPVTLAKGVKQSFQERDKPFAHIENKGYDFGRMELFIKHGMKAFNPNWFLTTLYDTAGLEKHPLLRPAVKEVSETLLGKGVDSYVFNHYIARNVYAFTNAMFERFVKEIDPTTGTEFTPDEAARLAVKFQSDATLVNTNIYGDEKAWLQAVLFARDFTMSFFRQMTGATYYFWQNVHGYKEGLGTINTVLHGEASRTDMQFLSKYYAAHLTKILLAKLMVLGTMQFALWHMRPPDDKDEKDKWMWLNERGLIDKVKLPKRDEDGMPMYIDFLIWREMTQFLNLATRGPGKFIQAKISYALGQTFDQWRGKDFRDMAFVGGEETPLWDRIRQRIGYGLKEAMPAFTQEQPRGLSRWSMIVGAPLKRGYEQRGVDPARSKRIRKAINRGRFKQEQVRRKIKNASRIQLRQLLAEGEITGTQYTNEIMLRRDPYGTMIRKNRKLYLENVRR